MLIGKSQRRRLLPFALLFVLLLPALLPAGAASADNPAPGAVFYVATDGSDSNDGSIDAPFLTLERARDAVRALKGASGLPEGGVTVYLRGGVYERTASFDLGEDDSGEAGKPVAYRAYPGETVSLSGGAPLDPAWFQPVTDQAILSRIISEDARGEVLVADLAGHGIADYGVLSRHGYYLANDLSEVPPMELYVNGQGMTLARWPNEGTVQMDEVVDPGPTRSDPEALKNGGGTFSYAYDRPQYWTQADDIWLDGIFGYSWEWSYNKIASIDTANKTITLRYGEMSGIFKNWYPDFHFAQNLLEELDMPGEYYIDRGAGKLYFMPNAEFAAGDAQMTVTMLKTPLVNALNASYVTFENLIMENGRDSAVVIMGGSHMRISHCEIRNFTNSGVLIGTQSRFYYNQFTGTGGSDHAVVDSHIHHIGGTAVTLTGGDKGTLVPAGNAAENSHIHDFAYYHKAYNPGVHLSGVGNRVSHNEIHDAPHPGILVFGNDHLIEYNEIYDVCKTFSDLGAIYMNAGQTPQERGTVIRRNYFHNIGESKAGVEGIYPDNMTMGLTIEDNIFYRMGNSGVKNNAGSHIVTRNNLFIDNKVPYDNADAFLGDDPDDPIPKDYMPRWQALFAANNNFVGTPHMAEYPELADFFTENRYYPDTNTFENNVVYNGAVTRSSTTNAQGAHDALNLLQYAGNWTADADPGFVDLAGGDLNLRPDAAVFDHIPDFRPIPFDEIGIQGKAGTTNGPDDYPVTGIAVYNDSVTVDRFKTAKLQTVVLPWNATNPQLNYVSGDPAVATVDGEGVVTGVAEGQTVITVSSAENPSIAAEAAVTVEHGDGTIDFTDFEAGGGIWPIDGNRQIVKEEDGGNHWYKILNGAAAMSSKEFADYELTFRLKTPPAIPANATFYVFDRQSATQPPARIGYRTNEDGSSRWLLYDGNWATVKQTTLPSYDLQPDTEYAVKVRVEQSEISVYVNDGLRLKVSNPGYTPGGKVGFYASGFAYLMVDDVRFKEPTDDVAGLLFDREEERLAPGQQLALQLSYDPADTPDRDVSWESDNPLVATVSGGGVVSAVYAGETTVTARSLINPNASASVRIVVSNVLHETDFESGSNGWPSDPNRAVTAIDGNHWYKLANGASAVLQQPTFADYELHFRIKTPSAIPNDAVFYVFDRQSSAPPGSIGYRTHADGSSKWILYNGAWTALKQETSAEPELRPDTIYDVRLTVQGGELSLYIDGALKLQGTNPGYNASGRIGFYVSGFSSLLIDDIVVSVFPQPEAEAAASAPPGQPVLSDDNGQDTGLADGSYKVAMNMWWGENGSLYQLYENGRLIDAQTLEAASPAAQSAVTAIEGRANGTYRYVARLINPAGVTRSAEHVVAVTAANPGRPVLSDDNWDGDGDYAIAMHMWWGTNGTLYRLYENGTVIDSRTLADGTPNGQSATSDIADRPAGRYEYVAELANAAGSAFSEPLVVEVSG